MTTHLASFTAGSDTTIDELIGSDAGNILSRKYTLLAGESIARGDVVGVITSGGKVIKSLSGAGDGSQTPLGIAAEDIAADTDNSPPEDKQVNVYTRGTFNENKIGLGASHTVASIREGLRDKGIYLETPVKKSPA